MLCHIFKIIDIRLRSCVGRETVFGVMFVANWEERVVSEVPDFDGVATRFDAFFQNVTILVKNPTIHNSYG